MRSSERDVLLFMLAASAGSADGWSYCGLGHAFVANMTGNTVLLGLAVFQRHGDLFHPLIALICYVSGAVIASFSTKRVPPGSVWTKAVSWTLVLEALLMGAAEAGWVVVHSRATHPLDAAASAPGQNLLLAGVAFAIGLQSGAILQLKIPGIVTTYITGTWTSLMNGLVRLATSAQSRTHKKELEFEERLLMQAGVLAAYFFSAVLTGWLFRYSPVRVGVLPAASVLFVAVYGNLRTRASRQ